MNNRKEKLAYISRFDRMLERINSLGTKKSKLRGRLVRRLYKVARRQESKFLSMEDAETLYEDFKTLTLIEEGEI